MQTTVMEDLCTFLYSHRKQPRTVKLNLLYEVGLLLYYIYYFFGLSDSGVEYEVEVPCLLLMFYCHLYGWDNLQNFAF